MTIQYLIKSCELSTESKYRYKAFISYRWKTEKPLAVAVKNAL